MVDRIWVGNYFKDDQKVKFANCKLKQSAFNFILEFNTSQFPTTYKISIIYFISCDEMLHGVVASHLRKDIYCILVNACHKILLFLHNNRFVSITRKVNLYTVLFFAKNKLPDFFSQNCHLDRFFLHILCGKNCGASMRKIKASALLIGYLRSSFSRFLL